MPSALAKFALSLGLSSNGGYFADVVAEEHVIGYTIESISDNGSVAIINSIRTAKTLVVGSRYRLLAGVKFSHEDRSQSLDYNKYYASVSPQIILRMSFPSNLESKDSVDKFYRLMMMVDAGKYYNTISGDSVAARSGFSYSPTLYLGVMNILR